MEQRDRISLDVAGLKALAHPLRLRLVGLLRAGGPATATELARRLGDTTSGTTSWHLRRLAEAGLVVEVPGDSGRERRWGAAHRTTTWDPNALLAQPGGAAALADWLQELVSAWASRTLEFVDNLEQIDRAWVDAAVFDDGLLQLTPAMLHKLRSELDQVVDRYRKASPRDRGASPVWIVIQAIPRPDLGPPGGHAP